MLASAAHVSLIRALRIGILLAVASVVFGILRWVPVEAALVPVGATPAGVVAVVLAVGAALAGGWEARWRWREAAVVGSGAALALVAVVALRPPAGLAPLVRFGDAPQKALGVGAVDFSGRDLASLGPARRSEVTWQGVLRVPETGSHTLTVEGRGQLTLELAGRVIFEGRGNVLRHSVSLRLGAGEHLVRAVLLPEGPGLRLRIGWTRPGLVGALREDPVPARFLGPPIASAWWVVTDALALTLALSLGYLAVAWPWARRALPAATQVTWGQTGLSLAGYGVLLVVMSWPLVTDPLHLGVMDRPDGRLNAWILAWDATALAEAPARLFHPPVFHPMKDALAFSENLLLPAVFVAPLNLAAMPVLAYNVVLLVSLALSGLAVERIVRRATGDPLAAFVAGAFFAAGPHRWTRLAHLHAQVTVFLPLTLLAFDRFLERTSWRRALVVGLFLGLQGLSSVYLGAITAAALAIAVLLAVPGGLGLRPISKVLCGCAVAGVVLLPLVTPYLRMRAFQGMEFDMAQVAAHASTLESYTASGTRLLGPITRRHIPPDRVQDTLFPGATVLVLGLVGLAAAPRRFRVFAVVAGVVAIVLSLGPATPIYRFLHEHLVLLRGIRALSRFSLIPFLSLAVLAGIALAGRRAWVTLGALALMMVESTNAPIGWDRYAGPSAAAQALAGGEGAVVHLPLGSGDTAAMLDSLAHGRPLVNGDSGFIPRPYTRAMELLSLPLSEDGKALLRALGVTDVVSAEETGLGVKQEVAGERVFALPSGPVASVAPRGTPVAAIAEAGETLLDLGAEREVSGFGFEVSDLPWVAQPDVWLSVDRRVFEPVAARASLAEATLSLYGDPRHGRGSVRIAPTRARFARLDARLPVRPGTWEALP